MALEPGSQLGRYQILSVIGSGGMGRVYTALDPALNRTLALKVLSESLSSDADFRERFLREALAVASLDHPNIVRIYDIGAEGSVLWIAMQLVDGGDLRDRIEAGPLPLDDAERFLRQLASALDAAHERGLVHRDVKPDNVLVSTDGSSVLLTDFGIAKGIDRNSELTQTGAFIGTPKYSAPEAITGGDVDRRADIYSLGVVAYEMLTGKPPFAGSGTEVIAAHLRDVPVSPRELRPELPRPLAAAVLRALEKERDARFASAVAFVDAAFVDRVMHRGTGPTAAGRPGGFRAAELIWNAMTRWIRARTSRPESSDPADRTQTVIRRRPQELQAPRSPAPSPEGRDSGDVGDHTIIAPAPRTVVFERAREDAAHAAADASPDSTQYVPRPGAIDLPVALAFLRSSDPSQLGRRILVKGPSFIVGRAENADLCIAGDPLLSRKHVEIVTEAGSYRIRAHGVNGAYVNGRLVAKGVAQPLFLNDWIMLSSATVLSFVADVPKMPDLTGKLLDGRFALERRIHESIKSATYA